MGEYVLPLLPCVISYDTKKEGQNILRKGGADVTVLTPVRFGENEEQIWWQLYFGCEWNL